MAYTGTDPTTRIGSNEQGSEGSFTPEQQRQYIARLQDLLNRGVDISGQLGLGLKVENGQVVQKGFWDRTKRDWLNVAIMFAAAGAAGALGPAVSGADTALPAAVLPSTSTVGVAALPTATGISSASALGTAGTSAVLPSTAAVGTAALPTTTGIGAQSAASGPGWGGFFKKVLENKGKTSTADTWGDLAKTLGSASQAAASNRSTGANLTQRADALKFDAAREQRAQESDAMRKLASTSYILNGGAPKMNFKVNSGTMPDFGFGPPPISDAERQGATSLQKMVMDRLTPEGALKATDVSTFLNRGAFEKGTDWASLIASGIGTARNTWGK